MFIIIHIFIHEGLLAMPVGKRRNCRDKRIIIKNQKQVLFRILRNYVVIEGLPSDLSAMNTINPIVKTKECPFTTDIDGPDGDRNPRIIRQARCPGCSLNCKPVVVRQMVLKRKYHPKIGTVTTMSVIDVTIGFFKQCKFT